MFNDIKEMKYNDCIVDISIILFNNIFDAEKNIKKDKNEKNLIKMNNLKLYKNIIDENDIIKEILLLFNISEEFDKNNLI